MHTPLLASKHPPIQLWGRTRRRWPSTALLILASLLSLAQSSQFDGAIDQFYSRGITFEGPGGILGNAELLSICSFGSGVVVAGRFKSISGQKRSGIARLLSDGTLDQFFADNLSIASYEVTYGPEITSLLPYSTNRLIIGGYFQSVDGLWRQSIAAIMQNGRIDKTFLSGEYGLYSQTGREIATCLTLLSNRNIAVGGFFDRVNDTRRIGVAMIDREGNLTDNLSEFPGLWRSSSFGANVRIEEGIDGSVIFAGDFKWAGGISKCGIARLSPGGSIDLNFPEIFDSEGQFASALALDRTGRVLIGGRFTRVGELPRTNIVRLEINGEIDHKFSAFAIGPRQSLSVPYIDAISVQSDGKILIGGTFTNVNGFQRNCIARLNDDGTLDHEFGAGMTGASDRVRDILVQPDGSAIVIGNFSLFNDYPVHGIAKIFATAANRPQLRMISETPSKLSIEVTGLELTSYGLEMGIIRGTNTFWRHVGTIITDSRGKGQMKLEYTVLESSIFRATWPSQ